MVFAQKIHSEEEMEANRIKFYKRFDVDQPHLTYEPTYEVESEGQNEKTIVSVDCCRDVD